MKRYKDSSDCNNEKRKAQVWKHEHKAGGFRCSHCRQFVVINDIMGTANRNHCNICLWSKHVDDEKGDRKSHCCNGMKPIGLTFKHDGYGRRGEVMLVHECVGCSKISINRIARDDGEHHLMDIYNSSLLLDRKVVISYSLIGIELLSEADMAELRMQLYGY